MSITVEATFENGLLRPHQPLPFKEHEQVRITVEALEDPVSRSYGLLKWTGDAETVERIALDPEFDVLEEP